jgi:hypothetical protein
MQTYVITVKGEFTNTLGIAAESEEEAMEQARQAIGETISFNPTGEVEILKLKRLDEEMQEQETEVVH